MYKSSVLINYDFFKEKNSIKRLINTFFLKKKILKKKRIYSEVAKIFLKLNKKYDEKLRIIDVGCGTGQSTIDLGLAFLSSEIMGIDIALKKLYFASKIKNFLKISNIEFIEHDAQKEFEGFGKFDLILCSDFINKFDSQTEIFLNICKMLKNKESLLSLKMYSKNSGINTYFFDKIAQIINSTNLKIHDYTFDHKYFDQSLCKEKNLNKLEEIKVFEKIIRPTTCTLILKK